MGTDIRFHFSRTATFKLKKKTVRQNTDGWFPVCQQVSGMLFLTLKLLEPGVAGPRVKPKRGTQLPACVGYRRLDKKKLPDVWSVHLFHF
jgi:hypothetical protein